MQGRGGMERQAPGGHISGTHTTTHATQQLYMGCESQLAIQNQVNCQSDKVDVSMKYMDISTNQTYMGLIWIPLDQMSHQHIWGTARKLGKMQHLEGKVVILQNNIFMSGTGDGGSHPRHVKIFRKNLLPKKTPP